MASWFRTHGVPAALTDELIEQGHAFAPFIRFARDPELLYEGSGLDDWQVIELPGHADGHLGFLREGVLIAGDHLLARISPAVGLYPESRPDPLGGYLTAVGRLLLRDAFFAAAGSGLVTARRRRIIERHHEGNRRARDVIKITSDPPRFISAMQLGVTLTSLGIGALGEHALAKAFDPLMATALAVAIAYLILTYLHVVIGELVPKGVALQHSEGTALAVSAPVRAFFTLFRPLIWVLQRSTEVVLRWLGLQPPGGEDDVLSEAELRMLVSQSTQHGEIEQQEQEMLYKVFDFADKEAADVMVPRPEVVALS